MKKLILIYLLINCMAMQAQIPTVSSGVIRRLEKFPSKYITARNIDIWLPKGYTEHKKYAVLYMHDGQMLFDSTITWNHQAWCVDKTLSELMNSNQIMDCIVIGIWNSGSERHADYYPQKPFEALPKEMQDSIYASQGIDKNGLFFQSKIHSDNYLKFLVHELKPYIDSAFSTFKDSRHTFIAGSSMGGLISMYAICEYPAVFGGAACLSTHWPGFFKKDDSPIPRGILDYFNKNLPDPSTHKFYFDYGTLTLDAGYEPYQLKADAILKARGYNSTNWMTWKFEGDDHSERSWCKRFHIPMEFLLSNPK